MPSITDFINTDYFEAYASLLPKSQPNPIIVYVESDEDIAFWRGIFQPYQDENEDIVFEFKLPSKTGLVKGKIAVLERSADIFEMVTGELGNYMLMCVDSDYDYLLQNHYQNEGKQATANKINDNPFIFQTYSYSIENLKCYAESLHQVCVDTTLQDVSKINLVAFLKLYSKTVYELLIWNLLFYSKGEDANFTLTDFCSHIKILEQPDMNNFSPQILANIRENVAAKVTELEESYPGFHTEITAFAESLKDLGLDSENAYLFLQGHTLFDKVVLMILKPLCKAIKYARVTEIKSSNTSQTVIINNFNQYQNNVGKVSDEVVKILSRNTAFQNCFLFKKIQTDIQSYLSGFHEN